MSNLSVSYSSTSDVPEDVLAGLSLDSISATSILLHLSADTTHPFSFPCDIFSHKRSNSTNYINYITQFSYTQLFLYLLQIVVQ